MCKVIEVLYITFIIHSFHQDEITVGPASVGQQLTTKALVFRGNFMTATVIAVASGFYDLGNKENVKNIPREVKDGALENIKKKLQATIDQVKVFKTLLTQRLLASSTH